MAEENVKISGLDEVLRDLAKIKRPDVLVRMNREIGKACSETTADWIASKVSPFYHKTADRLGAGHSGFYEFARGRVAQGEYRGTKLLGDETEPPTIEAKDETANGVRVVIGNVPGMARAFHALNIKPRKSKYLAVPIHRDSYNVRARDYDKKIEPGVKWGFGRSKKGNLIMFGSSEGKPSRPLYVLLKGTIIPQDRNLLPPMSDYQNAALDAAEAFRDLELM